MELLELKEETREVNVPLEEYKQLVKKEAVLDLIKTMLRDCDYLSNGTLKKILGMKEEETINESL